MCGYRLVPLTYLFKFFGIRHLNVVKVYYVSLEQINVNVVSKSSKFDDNFEFLANVNLCSSSLCAIAVPSVCHLSVKIFGKNVRQFFFSAIFLRHPVPSIPWPSIDIH